MISRSFSSEESATTPVDGERAVFFNFKNVEQASPSHVAPHVAQDHAARAMEPWAWRDIDGARTQQGHAAPLSEQPGWMKKRDIAKPPRPKLPQQRNSRHHLRRPMAVKRHCV
jgi:hypothetical protein